MGQLNGASGRGWDASLGPLHVPGDPARVVLRPHHCGWEGRGVSHRTAHTNVPRGPHLSRANRAVARGSLTRLTGHFLVRQLDKSAGESILLMWKQLFLCVFQSQIAISAGKPALKNKTFIEIDCFPVALPVVLWGAIKLPIFTLGFTLLFTVDFS